MATIELNGDNWKEFTEAEYSIIDCYGDFCSACVLLEPIYDGIADEMSEIKFGRINITKYEDIANEYNITALPTVLFFRNGEKVHQFIGSVEREDMLQEISIFLYQ